MRSTVTMTSSMIGPDSPLSAPAWAAQTGAAKAQPVSTAATACATDVDDLMTDSPRLMLVLARKQYSRRDNVVNFHRAMNTRYVAKCLIYRMTTVVHFSR